MAVQSHGEEQPLSHRPRVGLIVGRKVLIAFMGLASLEQLATRLIADGLPSSTPAAVVPAGTTEKEAVVTAPLGALAAAAAEISTPAAGRIAGPSRRSQDRGQTDR
jgi:uroporphyrin-III C-methyltransferase